MGRLTDEELWCRALSGNAPAFGELFERHSDAVYNHCFRRCASWSDAEDLTSLVFLEAWRRREFARVVADSILPWLLAIANNVARNARRSAIRYQRVLRRLPHPDVHPSPADVMDDRVDEERRWVEVLKVLHDLRPEEQDVVALCDWSGLTYQETAEALNIPVGTVRSRLSRARRRLRERISPDNTLFGVPIVIN